MKDYSKVDADNSGKFYYNERNQLHRLIGPAFEWWSGDKSYYINDIFYMYFSKDYNKLFIRAELLELTLEYEKYIKQNIKDLIQEYNPKIELSQYFKKEEINKLPNWIKDLIIL